MMRLTMLRGTKESFIQCVISSDQKSAFEALGFVDHFDSLPDQAAEKVPEEGSDYEAELREKIKALGGKPAGRSSIETLEKQLKSLEDDNHKE